MQKALGGARRFWPQPAEHCPRHIAFLTKGRKANPTGHKGIGRVALATTMISGPPCADLTEATAPPQRSEVGATRAGGSAAQCGARSAYRCAAAQPFGEPCANPDSRTEIGESRRRLSPSSRDGDLGRSAPGSSPASRCGAKLHVAGERKRKARPLGAKDRHRGASIRCADRPGKVPQLQHSQPVGRRRHPTYRRFRTCAEGDTNLPASGRRWQRRG